jgi:hypothetical protein
MDLIAGQGSVILASEDPGCIAGQSHVEDVGLLDPA